MTECFHLAFSGLDIHKGDPRTLQSNMLTLILSSENISITANPDGILILANDTLKLNRRGE